MHSRFSTSLTSTILLANLFSNGHGHTISLQQKPRAASTKSGSGQVTIDQGFWFASVDVGKATNLSLLLDTGSSNVVVNPGLFKASDKYKALDQDFDISYGTTSSSGGGSSDITGKLQQDQVTFAGLTVTDQTIGVTASNSTTYPHDGIIGFAGQRFSANNATTFFHNLCEQGLVEECRFGLALTSNGTGTLSLGKLESDMFDGELTVVPILEEWYMLGDVLFGGDFISNSSTVMFDIGSATITGPVDAVTSIFNATGVKGYMQEGTLIGYLPCDTKMDDFGMSFPAQAVLENRSTTDPFSDSATIFNLTGSNLLISTGSETGSNNCTFAISGADVADVPGLWVLGQDFFQGIYIDHNLVNGTVGIAEMKATSTSSSTNSSSTSSTSSSASATASTHSNSGNSVVYSLSKEGLAFVLGAYFVFSLF